MHSVYIPEENYLEKQKGINACIRKDTYIKIEHAIQQAKLASEREGERIIWYRCKVCATFHLSHLRNLKIDWKNVRKIIGTNNITYVMFCPNGDIHINDIYHYGFIIAYKMSIGVFKHCTIESPKFHNINIYSSLIELHANEKETELYQKLLEDYIMVKENVVPVSVKVEKSHPIPELNWKGYPVIKGKKGYIARVPITCKECYGEEFAIKKVSVVAGVVTRGQGIFPENPEMIKPKPGAKDWIHKSCAKSPVPVVKKEKKIHVHHKEQKSKDVIPTDKKDMTLKDLLPFSADTVMNLAVKLDPENAKVTDAQARGMSWLFVQEIFERLTK